MKIFLQMFAPWLSVLIFWLGFRNAWAAILGYHAQVLLWHRREDLWRWFRQPRPGARWTLPLLLTAPVMIAFLPWFLETEISAWMAAHGLSAIGFVFMVPYFGIVHPVLEQGHWGPLRLRTRWAHPMFAGYHLLVLSSLLTSLGLLLAFVVLYGASLFWQRIPRGTAILSHQLADTGVALAGLWMMFH
ncbi:MAG: hypothetical protein JJU29_03615 [Verrucomicrobia bacterium]|nr:hypothetical protein [Verrucomicrobiota bacterium]MCH8511072.1 hypothetical protein [Kiritimatiellia bacterium]